MKISVVLPVYNGEAYIDEALTSVLNQTFEEFELLVVDDGSTDSSAERVKSYRDSRIRLIRREHGFIESLNAGLAASGGKYIARMDVDDRMEPHRLARQWEVMEEYEEVAVCGSWFKTFGKIEQECASFRGKIPYPLVNMLNGNILAHPTVMMRNRFLKEHGLCYENYPYAEDFKLWSEVAKRKGVFYVIPEFLMNYRVSDEQVSCLKSREQYDVSLKIRSEILDFLVDHNAIEMENICKLRDLITELNERDWISETAAFQLFADLFYHLSESLPAAEER